MSLSDLDKDLDTAAAQATGNWRKFESFAWSNRPENAERYMIVNTTNRDADLVTQSNHATIERALKRFTGGKHPSVREHRAGHWAVGWVEGFEIKVYDRRGKVTKAFTEYHSLALSLASYPILDESDLSEREYKAQCEAIERDCSRFLRSDAPEGWPGKVFGWLWDNREDVLTSDRENTSIDSADAIAALKALGLLDPEHDDETETAEV